MQGIGHTLLYEFCHVNVIDNLCLQNFDKRCMEADVVGAFGCVLDSVDNLILVFTTLAMTMIYNFYMRDAIPYLPFKFIPHEGRCGCNSWIPYPHKSTTQVSIVSSSSDTVIIDILQRDP